METAAAVTKKPAAEPLGDGAPPATIKTHAKRSCNGTRKLRPSRAKGGASLYKDVAETIACPSITVDTVERVCKGLRDALIHDVREHGSFKIYGLSTFKLKHMHGRPARAHKMYDMNTKKMVEREVAARTPSKRVVGRVLAPLQKLLRDPHEGAPSPSAP